MTETEESPAAVGETSPTQEGSSQTSPTTQQTPDQSAAQAPDAAAPPPLYDLNHPFVLRQLQGAFDRQRNTENQLVADKVRPLLHKVGSAKWIRVPVGAPGAYVNAPMYAGESETDAAGRATSEYARRTAAMEQLMGSGELSALSFNTSSLLTGQQDEEARAALESSGGARAAEWTGVGLSLFVPSPFNVPALAFGKLANTGSAAVRLILSKNAPAISQGLRSAWQAAMGTSLPDVTERPVLTWLSRKFGDSVLSKLRPVTFEALKDAASKAGVTFTGSGAVNMPPGTSTAAADAFRIAWDAAKAEIGSQLKVKLTRAAPEIAGNFLAGTGLGAGYALGAVRNAEDVRALPGNLLKQGVAGGVIGAGAPLAVQGALRLAESGAGKLQTIFDSMFAGSREAAGTAGEGVLASANRSMRLLGAPDDVVVPGARPLPEPGPQAPPVSHIYRPAPVVKLPGAPQGLAADVHGLFEEGRQRLVTVTDPVEADRLHKGLNSIDQLGGLARRGAPFVAVGPAGTAEFAGWQDLATAKNPNRPPISLWNVPVEGGGGMTTVSAQTLESQGYEIPPLLPTPADVGAAQKSLLRAGLDLLGSDHAALSRMLGFDHTQLLYGGGAPMPIRDLPRLAEAARWGGALSREAARAGVDLSKTVATLPPIPVLSAEPVIARLAGLAKIIREAAPNAAVDPPPDVLAAEPSLMPRPSPVENAAPGWALPSAHDIDLDLRGSLPSPTLRSTDAPRAARQQQWVTAHLASFQPFEAGRLVATQPHALGELDSRVVPVKVDEEGRLLVQVQDPHRMDGTITVDVTSGLRPAALLASAGWKFEPAKLAPVELALDPKSEALVVDPDGTAKRSWAQHMIRTTLHDAHTGGLSLSDPLRLLSSFIQSPPASPREAAGYLRQAERLLEEHRAKVPSPEMARREVGRTASDWEVARRHGEMAQEFMRIGSMLEAVRSVGLSAAPPPDEFFGFAGGADLPDWIRSQRGRWFTGSRSTAENYARRPGGAVLYVDVPSEVAQAMSRGRPTPMLSEEFTLPDTWLAQAKVLPPNPKTGIYDSLYAQPPLASGLTRLYRGMSPEEVTARFGGKNLPVRSRDIWPKNVILLGPADLAARRAEALAHASTGGGWSNKQHLFDVLTPDEKFEAVLARLKAGRIRGSKNLEALNPARAKPPRYWGAWKPTPEQARALADAYAERRQRELANWGTLGTLRARAAKGAAARSAAEWKPLELEDILKIDPADLERLAEKEPHVFHETLSSFMGSVDGAIARAGSAEDLEKIEVIRQALRDVGDKTLDDAVANFEAVTAANPKLSWIQSAYLAATQPLRWARFMAATQQRPMGALGWRKQAPEARSFAAEWGAGRIQRGLFWPLMSGHTAQNEMQLRLFTEFRPLMEAAAASPRLNFAISHALEHRLSEATGELDRPEYTFQVRIRPVGPPTTFKLSEWVPRLKARYDTMIADLEREKVQHLATERNDHHADALWLAQKLHEHELHAAQQIDPSITSWEQIAQQPEVKKGGRKTTSFLEDLRARIRKEGSGLPVAAGDPAFIAGSYRDLSRVPYDKLWQWYRATLAAHAQAQSAIDAINRGELRQLGYVTRLSRHLGDSVAQDMSDPYHPTSRYLPDHVKNDFIDKQRQGLVPANLGWLEGFLMYVPKAAQTIHLEPAIQRVKRKIMAQGPDGRPEVPEFQRQYAHDWVNSLLGKQHPQSRIFNRMMFEGLEQPLALDDFVRNALGKDPAGLVRAAKAGGQLRRRAFDEVQNNYNGLMFLSLLGPAQLAAMNMTEYSFLARELSKHPPDMLRGMWWVPKAFAGRSAPEGVREALTAAKHQLLPQAPLWYAEPTYKGVTDFLHDLDNPIQAGAAAPVGKSFGRVYKLIQKMWGSYFRSTQYPLQSTNYYVDLERLKKAFPREVAPVRTADGKLRHIVPEWMKTVAALQANDNVGVFTRANISPYSTGPAGKFFMPLRRFTFGHIEHLLTAATGALETVPGFAKESPWPEASEPPLPPAVPGVELPNDGAWEPDDLKDWQRYNAPAAQYGTMYSAGGAKWRHLSQLTLGMGATAAALWYSGTLLFSNDETQDGPLINMLNPYNVERLFEIPTGWWWRDAMHAMSLSAQGAFRDLTSREVYDRDNSITHLLWDMPGGRVFRNQYIAAVRHRQFRAAEAAAGHPLPPEPPKAPEPPLAPGTTRPGTIERGIGHLPSAVQTALYKMAPKHLVDQLPPEAQRALRALGPKQLRRELNAGIIDVLLDVAPNNPMTRWVVERMGAPPTTENPAPPGP